MSDDKQVKFQCRPEKFLVGWDEIKAHLKDIRADRLIDLSMSALQAYADDHNFPTFVTRYGKVASNTVLIHQWLMSPQRGQLQHETIN